MAELDIRLIATDVDGTILPHGGAFSEATRRAVRRCRERGIPFIVNSGRWIGALQGILEDLGAADQPVITVGGGAVLGPGGRPLREWTMAEADVRAVYAVMRRFPVMINSYVRGGVYRLNTDRMPRLMKNYMGERDPRVVLDDRDAFESEGLRNVYKLEAVVDDVAVIAGLRDALARETDAVISGAFWNNTEVVSRGMGKGVALRWLAARLGVDPQQCMAFGDNTNDLDMLRAVGWPVAVGNAVPQLKAVARIIAPPDAEDGVARTIFESVLGEEMP